MSILTREHLVDEMIAAIAANIEYLKTNGNSQIRLENGRFKYPLDENYVYEFKLEYLQDIDQDADIEVKISGRTYAGKINAIRENQIEIAINQNVGESISRAILMISNYYLLEKLHAHLTSLKGMDSKEVPLLDKTFGISETTIGTDKSYAQKPDDKLNEYQEAAVMQALGSDVTFIWGPPGTGKSATIAKLFRELIDRGKSILLIAHTNAATDSVLSEVIKVMNDHDAYRSGKIIRIGSAKVIRDDIKNTLVMPEMVIEEKARPLREEISSIKPRLTKISQEIKEIEEYFNILKDIRLFEDNEVRLTKRLQDTLATYNEDEERLARASEAKDKADALITDFQNRGRLSRLVSGTSLSKLTEQKIEVLQALNNATSSINTTADKYDQLKSERESNNKRLEHAKARLGSFNNFSEKDAQKLKKEHDNLTDQIDALTKRISQLEETLIIDAQAVVTTLTKTYMHKGILDRRFDAVLLDEASMAPLPAIASAAATANEKVILVGDFLQLPPIAQHKVDESNKSEEEVRREQELIDLWLKRDIFNSSRIEDDVENGRDVKKGWMRQLKRQYRMHPDISYFINELIYAKNGDKKYALEDDASTYSNGLDLLSKPPLANSHIGIYDTSTIGAMPIRTESGSTYNLTHALLAVQLAKEAVDNSLENVGIISSYRAQVNLLNKVLADEDEKYSRHIEADTVHRFQGGAKDLIIFDVTSPQTNTMYDLRGSGDDAKLINVAISRAKDKFIYLVDKAAVLKNHSDSSLIRKSIEIVDTKNYPVISAEEALTNYRADDRTEFWLAQLNDAKDIEKEINNSKLFDEFDFYSYFHKDLLNAEHEVIIQSAFLTEKRVAQLVPIFSHVIKKGVRLFVLTRKASEQSGAMIEQSEKSMKMLESIGVVVLPMSGRVHQKYAIIDRKRMWEGSLNILSQRDSSETMRRIEGPNTVVQFMDFHHLTKNLGELGSHNLVHCEFCNEPGSYYWTASSRYGGFWTFCLTGWHAQGKMPKSNSEKAVYTREKEDKKRRVSELRRKVSLNTAGKPVCPEHSKEMRQKTGRFGIYYECPLSKECGCTISDAQYRRLHVSSVRVDLG